MLKKTFFTLTCLLSTLISTSQILFSERFNTLALSSQSYSTTTGVVNYGFSDLPATLVSINNGDKVADTLSANYPFKNVGQKRKGWLSFTKQMLNDTFAVSTSWLKPSGNADAWLITPVINNITANTVLSWEAMAPDVLNKDGYEVYIVSTTNTLPLISEFNDANRFYTNIGENTTWTKRGLSLSSFAGQSIKIAFRNNSNNKYQLWLDDIVVENAVNSFDFTTQSSTSYNYTTINTTNVFNVAIKNMGSSPINNVVLNYKVGNNSVVSEQKNVASVINYLDVINVSFNTPFITSVSGYYDVKIWVSALNGQVDQNQANDTLLLPLTVLSSVPQKNILIENYTSVKCGNCGDAQNQLEYAAQGFTNVIIASHHNQDSLINYTSDVLKNDYQVQNAQLTIDQYQFNQNSNKLGVTSLSNNDFLAQRQNMIAPASVTVTGVSYNSTTRQIDATVSSTFYGDVNADYRLNLYVKENNVYGAIGDNTDNGWNQYNTSYLIPTSPFYEIGNYLNADTYILKPNQFKHQFVIHAMLDSAYGAAAIIPNTPITNGQTYSKTYSYTLPVNSLADGFVFNADNIYLIGVLTKYDANPLKRAVINAAEVKLTSAPAMPVSIKEIENIEMSIYPNPASKKCFVRYQSTQKQWHDITIYNSIGELVYTQTHQSSIGQEVQEINTEHLVPGIYYITIKSNTSSFLTQPLIIIK